MAVRYCAASGCRRSTVAAMRATLLLMNCLERIQAHGDLCRVEPRKHGSYIHNRQCAQKNFHRPVKPYGPAERLLVDYKDEDERKCESQSHACKIGQKSKQSCFDKNQLANLPGSRAKEAKQAELAAAVNYQSKKRSGNAHDRHYDGNGFRTFAITFALEAVAVIVAVMGIAGALLALVIDRRRELGLLRFLGAAGGQVRKLILVEAGLLGLLANLAGIALGFALSLVLIFVINKQSFGWTIRFHWPVEILLGALTVVYVATVLAGLYPAQVAVRLNPLEVVHEE